MTPIQLAAFKFVAERAMDFRTGRSRSVLLTEISEPMRQKVIDLAMMEPALVDTEGPRVVLTIAGHLKWREIADQQVTTEGK